MPYLEERQKEVELLPSATTVKVPTAKVEHCADKPDTEEVVWHVERVHVPARWRTAG